jgi:hypothetical protein
MWMEESPGKKNINIARTEDHVRGWTERQRFRV